MYHSSLTKQNKHCMPYFVITGKNQCWDKPGYCKALFVGASCEATLGSNTSIWYQPTYMYREDDC